MTQHSKNETSEDELQAQLSAQTELVNQLTVKNMALEYDYGRYFMSHGVTKAIFLRKKSTGMNLPRCFWKT